MPVFKLISDFKPAGDQPAAIDSLVAGLREGRAHQVLLGVTGSGKTFTMAHVIGKAGRPALVIAHNKTLAAQLYGELRRLFPENAVHYFVSYYDYYQPEAYIPASDTYIEKDATINDEIDRMRHAATCALLTRKDVVIVASVSCIYGIGAAESYYGMVVHLQEGGRLDRQDLLRKLVENQYERNDVDFHRGAFRVRGDVVEIFPASEREVALRVEFFGDAVEAISEIDSLKGRALRRVKEAVVFPNSHYVTPAVQMKAAIERIRAELAERLAELRSQAKLLEAQRLEERTLYDLEMLEQFGFCQGIENYSRHLAGRAAGEAPPTLIDYFPKDFILFLDESHQTIPQLHGMWRGDRSRKENLVKYGFRLPSALDNRPLRFEEFERKIDKAIYVSATPADFEISKAEGVVVEQVIRPTGLIDPEVEVRPARNQVDDLVGLMRDRVAASERVLVTTLTKRMAEELTEYYEELGFRVRYLHSDIETLERIEILRDLRLGRFDVLVGINLLREGLDLPEVSLVAVMDADKEGFLRSATSLIQTIGRAARNVRGKVVLYADEMTGSIRKAVSETNRRRKLQSEYNRRHGITPETIRKDVLDIRSSVYEADYYTVSAAERPEDYGPETDVSKLVRSLEKEMREAARRLEFEKAAELRDRIKRLTEAQLSLQPRR